MKKEGFSAEQTIGKLREAEVLLGEGSPAVYSAVQQRCSKKKRSYRAFSVTP